eukprot:scaffold42521_cov36-Phaeocystis_antarctica.AAC.1
MGKPVLTCGLKLDFRRCLDRAHAAAEPWRGSARHGCSSRVCVAAPSLNMLHPGKLWRRAAVLLRRACTAPCIVLNRALRRALHRAPHRAPYRGAVSTRGLHPRRRALAAAASPTGSARARLIRDTDVDTDVDVDVDADTGSG